MFLYKRSNGYYYVFFKSLDGKWRSRSTKTRSEPEASRFMSGFRGETSRGKRRIFLSQFRRSYLEYSRTNHAPATTARARFVVDHFSRVLGDRLLDTISPQDIEGYKSRRLATGISPVTMNIELRTLKAFFSVAVAWDLIERSPFKRVRLIRLPERSPVYFSVDDFRKLVGEMNLGWLRSIVTLAVNTGLRRCELVNLRWRDVDSVRRTLKVSNTPGYRTKTGHERVVPLNDSALDVLAHLERATDFVFNNSVGKRPCPSDVSRQFKLAVRAAKLGEEYHFHSLRHTFASWLAQAGVSLYEIKELLGHTNIITTQVYAHLQPETLHATVNKISLNLN